MKLLFTEDGWKDYTSCQQDRRLLRRIHRLIADIQRGGNEGVGKPEYLRGDYSGWMSRRIDDKNRLVYRLIDDAMEITECGGHYQDR